MVDSMHPEDAQRAIEYAFGRKHVRSRIDRAIRENPAIEAKVAEGIQLLEKWLSQEYWESKNKRLKSLKSADLEQIVRTTFNVVAFCQTPELFTSVVGRLAAAFNLPEKVDNIKTAAEILAVLCETDAYDIRKPDRMASLEVIARFPLPKKLRESIERSMYLPPMLVPPKKYKNNFTSPYLTLDKDCLILGKGNAHTGDICLDVLNIQNNVELRLCSELLNTLEEKPPKELGKHNIEDWNKFLAQSKEVYSLVLRHGGTFFLPYKVDKRGRMYSLGYHINTQGYEYKKASIELADAEVVEGVPPEHRL